MPEQQRPQTAPDEAKPSPGTDPTNPSRQESAGEWTSHEKTSQRHSDEPGITDEERDRRGRGA